MSRNWLAPSPSRSGGCVRFLYQDSRVLRVRKSTVQVAQGSQTTSLALICALAPSFFLSITPVIHQFSSTKLTHKQQRPQEQLPMVLIPIRPKERKLLIHVDTGDSTIGPRGLPLVHGNQDAITMLHATVSFESSHDCKAKAIEIMFKAAVRTGFFCTSITTSRRHRKKRLCQVETHHLPLLICSPRGGKKN